MEEREDNLEGYLAGFRPRAVRALPLPRKVQGHRLRWLAAAAAVLFCLGMGYRKLHTLMVVRTIELKSQNMMITRIGLADSKMLDQFLFDESRNVLPAFDSDRSMLRVLAKE